jgi:hypothetical protein
MAAKPTLTIDGFGSVTRLSLAAVSAIGTSRPRTGHRRHHFDFALGDAHGAIDSPLQEANVKPFQIETRRGGRSLAAFVRRIQESLRYGQVLWWVLIFASSRIQEVEAASRSTQLVSPSESVDNEKAFLKQLWPVLDRGEKVGRIYYRGSCLQDANLGISFRQLDVRPAPVGESGVAAVKSILRDEKSISVEADDSGVIRIRIGRVPDAILHIRIPRLTLSPEEQFNAGPQSGRFKTHRKCDPRCTIYTFARQLI